LYNATAVHPYGLPAAQAVTGLQTWTSPGNGETQGFRLGDDAGGEAFFLHAARDLTEHVGGNREVAIDGNETHAVGLGLLQNVLGAETITVGGNQSIDVGEPIQIKVEGANTEAMALEIVSVKGNRVVSAGGGYEESVGGAYVLQCNQSNTKTKGAFTRTVGGSKSIAAALGVTESVAGARTHAVGGHRMITCGSTYSESIKGGKRSAAGAVEEKAGADWGMSAPTGNLSSGTATLRAGGTFVIGAASVTIDVSGSLTAGALEMAGGALKAKSGTTLLNGLVKRDQGGKAGA
jgi:type VI secretion system secreted protein VgrG